MGQWGKGNACGRLRARGLRARCSKIRAHYRKKKKKKKKKKKVFSQPNFYCIFRLPIKFWSFFILAFYKKKFFWSFFFPDACNVQKMVLFQNFCKIPPKLPHFWSKWFPILGTSDDFYLLRFLLMKFFKKTAARGRWST